MPYAWDNQLSEPLEVTVLSVKDTSKLLADIPKGAWVALSRDEERVLAYAAELQEVLKKAKDAGEEEPIIARVPEASGSILFV